MVRKAAVAFGNACLISPALCRSVLRRRNAGAGTYPSWRYPIGSAIMHALMKRYYDPVTSTEERERLKSLRTTGKAGVAWARHYAGKGFPDHMTALIPMWRWLEELLDDTSTGCVHQVACSSGREIAHYARNHPNRKFIGSDMDDQVVAHAASRWSDIDNLRFVRLDLLDATACALHLSADLIFSSGSLQYLDQPSLRQFFERAHRLAPRILVHEPVRAAFAAARAAQSTPKGNFAWNHDYADQLERVGYIVAREDVVALPGAPWARQVCVMAARS